MSGNGLTGNGLTSRVLLVDDDRDLLDLLAFLCNQAGLVPLVATEPAKALDLAETEHPSVAVIDLNLRPWDGFELVAELRRRNPRLPILVLTARGSEDDKVRALDLGADDYVVKPFGHRELVARIKAQVRRTDLEGDREPVTLLEVGPLRLDLRERTLHLDAQRLRLSGNEFRLLEYLMRHSDSVVPTAALARYVWGYDDAPARDVVRVTVHRLRRKLGDDGQHSRFIETVPGVGLKLRAGIASQETPASP
jgi:two-component system alkaline phosphatase synthesis response regulator PhoP